MLHCSRPTAKSPTPQDESTIVFIFEKCIKLLLSTLYGFEKASVEPTPVTTSVNANEKSEKPEKMEIVDGSSPQKKKQKLMSLGNKDGKDNKDDNLKDKPLIAQNILLRILAEIVSSYPQCAACITQESIYNS